jgi:hypothetical protein
MHKYLVLGIELIPQDFKIIVYRANLKLLIPLYRDKNINIEIVCY